MSFDDLNTINDEDKLREETCLFEKIDPSTTDEEVKHLKSKCRFDSTNSQIFCAWDKDFTSVSTDYENLNCTEVANREAKSFS